MDIQVELTQDEILNVISELDIFKYYCSNFKEIDKPFSSEFREDPKPSCRINLWDGYYIYKDFGESFSNNCWGYVMRKFDCNYREALLKVTEDMITESSKCMLLPTLSAKSNHKAKKIQPINNGAIIKVKRRPWDIIDTEFWYNKYGISQQTLELYNVAPISHFWINSYLYTVGLSNAYSYYYYKDTLHRFKIYQPYSKTNKWFSNINGTIIQGINVLPKSGAKLIITKSLKDVITLYELGYNAIAPNNETSFIPELNINKFKQRFKDIYIYFDSDETGIKNGNMFAEKYGFKAIFNPIEDRKDISDVVCYNGQNYAQKLLKQLIQ